MRAIIAVPATLLLIIRAHRRKSLTPVGILAAAITATIHALHPSPLPFTLLVTFFLLGTTATKVKHEVKATLTLSSSGSSGGEGPRTSVQVFANSLAASLLVLRHLWVYGLSTQDKICFGGTEATRHADLLLMGIMANYAAVTADTLSSELGILSKGKPLLITSLRAVPPGTNGGVSGAGLLAGIGGAAVIAANCCLLLDLCDGPRQGGEVMLLAKVFVLLTGLGTVGTLLDSLLGAVLQASVVDRRSGKIVEGAGGVKVLTRSGRGGSQGAAVARPAGGGSSSTGKGKEKADLHESRVINSGRDVLDNNQINLLMASIVSGLGVFAGTLL
ncbi:hypothetical protein LTR84_005325 [Exophiala bonariae]|uniref:TIGR00297 family protein n=1 Tax=Exophiala bonariae TaxID=1690606 RepID=A0AAV9N3E8_9EURO|nr:hypothetical protein LTR84_005325 [Exophiala bonariae]